ncbi:hypothetical protein ACWPKO_25940 (plasmid) [Coraliomargarita sp. W4R53]
MSEAPDDDTAVSARRRAVPAQHPSPLPSAAGPRRSAAVAAEPIEPDDGSTIVVRRGLRAERAAGVAAASPNEARQVPPAVPEEHAYPVRSNDPVRIERTAPTDRPAQIPVNSEGGKKSLRRQQLRFIAGLCAGSLILIGLIIALVLTVTTG